MTALIRHQSHPDGARLPTSAALLAAVVFAGPLTTTELHRHTPDSPDPLAAPMPDIFAYAALIWLAVVLTSGLGARSKAVPKRRLAHHGLGLATASALTLLIPWTGLPHLLGAAATTLAIQHRRSQHLGTVPATSAGDNVRRLLAYPTRLTS